MADLIYIALTIAFFGVAGLYVAACERIVGPDETVAASPVDEERAAA
jgi:hypothetical protein